MVFIGLPPIGCLELYNTKLNSTHNEPIAEGLYILPIHPCIFLLNGFLCLNRRISPINYRQWQKELITRERALTSKRQATLQRLGQ